MQISVIIPAYNRVEDLGKCLESILRQTFLPGEVIIVDNSNREEIRIKKMAEGLTPSFGKRNIRLIYIHNKRENSSTVARNMGIQHSSGNIISFLDDDVILREKYYEEIIKVFKDNPKTLGVEGKVIFTTEGKRIRFFVAQLLGRLFSLGFIEKNRCRVLPSLGVTYTSENKIINCQWISGASVFKKEVFKKFRYDENLKKYSDGEDIDISFRIFRKYPHSLFIAPEAKYFHKVSPVGRVSGREKIRMKEIYRLYIFYKVMEQTFKHRAIYLWSRIGEIIFKIISVLTFRTKVREVLYLIEAYALCVKHLAKIKKGDLLFFNETLR